MRAYLKVDLPELAGAKRLVEVPGLGAVINPGTYEVPEELLPQYKALHGVELRDANFQPGIEYVEVPDQVDQDHPDALKSSPTIEEKTQEQVEAEFEEGTADNDAREKEEGGN